MNGRVSDTDTPDLGVGVTSQECFAGPKHVLRHLEGSRVNVEGHDLPVMTRLDLRTDLTLVNLRTSSSVLLHAVARLPDGHISLP